MTTEKTDLPVSRQVQQNGTVIDVIGLTKTFKDFWRRERVAAVRDVSFNVQKGEVFGLLGPNGSGKTTIIHCIQGLLFPTGGRISILGYHPRDIRIRHRIGYQPEESYLYKYLNTEETLDFYGKLFGIPSYERKKRIEYLIDLVGLRAAKKRPLGEYSKGMARRLCLAQALINDPELVILDEPTAGMDPLGTHQIKDLIKEFRSRGKTVFLSSHLLADVEDVCDRIAILFNGSVCATGSIQELLKDSSKIQIQTGLLSSQTLDKIKELVLSQNPDLQFLVTQPRETLEAFFLKIIPKL
ncbi:multidrug ABC transporter ATP-binding protein [bacterium Unc6]|nr:multidrug ABC transporter ATP-binding protein [bacterium Unc6]